MLTLGINTASKRNAVCLIDGGRVIDKLSWVSKNKHAETLLPSIEKLLKKNKVNFQGIKRIVAVRGHGSFSAVRSGVTVANILAFCTGAALYAVETREMWKSRLPTDARAQLLVHAGGTRVLASDGSVKDASKWKNKGPFFGELTPEEESLLGERVISEKKLLSFGGGLARMRPSAWKRVKIIEPLYLFPPNVMKIKARLARPARLAKLARIIL